MMEIIFEAIFTLFGFALQALVELLILFIFELLAEFGMTSLVEPFRRPRPIDPALAGLGYILYGALAGGLSLLLPPMFTVPMWLRILNLIITPIACGLLMAKLGQMRERRGNRPLRIDTFVYGYLFALSMATVRFVWR